jgi:ribosomal protein S12 methylthiotransferase
MQLQKRVVRARQKARVGETVRVLIDGPSGDHTLVLKGRLASQAPDLAGAVYLTDCDPSRYAPGSFALAEVVGAKDYDLIARPAG